MQDHIFETFEEEQERETVDSLAELEHFWFARGDDRLEFSPYEPLPVVGETHETVTTSRPRISSQASAPDPSTGAGASESNRKEAA